MRYDILLAGVGGQGVLTAAALIAFCAMKEGLHVKQSEVHGMAQRGGSVSAHLRLSDEPIWSDLVPHGSARLIVSAEPLEALRYLDYLAPDGAIVSASEPVRNMPVYPDEAWLRDQISSIGRAEAGPSSAHRSLLVDAEKLAKEAGLPQAQAVVLVGAAAVFLPFRRAAIEEHIREAFATKAPSVVEANVRAFRAGLAVGVRFVEGAPQGGECQSPAGAGGRPCP